MTELIVSITNPLPHYSLAGTGLGTRPATRHCTLAGTDAASPRLAPMLIEVLTMTDLLMVADQSVA